MNQYILAVENPWTNAMPDIQQSVDNAIGVVTAILGIAAIVAVVRVYINVSR